ncbi:DUF6049 family protein [Microlunatus panaciterrae]|uniref:Uncharacterized protein n=1 Tax=Microlunatus panaciterrae TaxID=400768 RepID=A0ABS2RK04_9ACTN|nr:hypothetical protein [Microlunatus panaciterrae]
MTRRAGSWLTAAGALGIVVLLLQFLAPAQARAEPKALVTITLSSFTPDVPTRSGEITVSGTVTNTSDQNLYRLQAIFWRSQEPITSSEGMDQALTSPADQPLGARVVDGCGPHNGQNNCFQNLYRDTNPVLAPGGKEKFTITVKVSQLQLPSTDGVYLMGVHVRGTTDGSSSNVTMGRSRVFVPVLERMPSRSMQLTSIVLLSSTPSMVRPDVFADEHLAAEISEGGRLSRLLAAADRPEVTFAVDPALVDELERMRDGYRVVDSDGKTTDGTGSDAAGAWLDRFAALRTTRDGYRLPFAVPDLAALSHDGRQDIISGVGRAARKVTSVASLPLLAYPAAGQADATTLQTLESMDPAAILLADTAAGGRGPLLEGPGSAPIVTFGSRAFAGGPGPDPRNTPVHLRQRLLADTWLRVTTAAPGSTLGRVRVITSPAQAVSDAESLGAPWMRQTTLTELLRSRPTAWPQKLSYPAAERQRELSPALLQSLRGLSDGYRIYAELLQDPSDLKARSDAALARSASAWWRDPRSGATFRNLQRSDLAGVLSGDKVQLSATREVLFAASRSSFPMTVTNKLDAPIKFKVAFTSANSQRLSVAPVAEQRVEAGETVQINAEAEAKANGPVLVTAQLTTVSGAKIGKPLTINVKATDIGVVGWVITLAAGVVLVGTTALRIRQVRRERSKEAGG